MYVRYNVYSWTPPKLTPEQEIQVGRQIVLEGREAFLRKKPYLSDEEKRRIQAGRNMTTMQKIIAAVIFIPLAIVALAVAWLPILIAFVAISIYSGGSLLYAKSRYRNWVDEMIAKYAAYAAKHPEGRMNVTAKTQTRQS